MERSFQPDEAHTAGSSSPTRTRVLAAAAELFAARGFAATTIAEIRKVSGASASSIYWEFGSKEGILGAVLEDAATRWLNQTHQPPQTVSGAGTDQLAVAFEQLAAELTERPEFLRLLLLLALERREGDLATLGAIRRVRDQATRRLADGFRVSGLFSAEVPDQLVHDVAAATLAFADGAFVAAQIDPGEANLRRMFAIFYAGLRAALGVEGMGIFEPVPGQKGPRP